MAKRILLVDDEPLILKGLTYTLEQEGYETDIAMDGEEALSKFMAHPYDLVLLDVMLPRMNGFEVMGRLPDDQPVIFVTARTGLDDRLRGLNLGADDYIVKPFEILELLARVENVLRRTRRNSTEFTFRDLRVDLTAHRVFREGVEVNLTPQEYALFEALVINRNLALSRDKLLAIAWGYDYEGETRTVDVHINRLRHKLGLADHIQTVYKVGYRFNTKD